MSPSAVPAEQLAAERNRLAIAALAMFAGVIVSATPHFLSQHYALRDAYRKTTELQAEIIATQDRTRAIQAEILKAQDQIRQQLAR